MDIGCKRVKHVQMSFIIFVSGDEVHCRVHSDSLLHPNHSFMFPTNIMFISARYLNIKYDVTSMNSGEKDNLLAKE